MNRDSENLKENDFLEDGSAKLSYVHCHRFYELHVMLEGSCAYRVGDSQFLLSAGQYCLFAPEVYHAPQDTGLPFRCSITLLSHEAHGEELTRQLLEKTGGAPVYIGDAGEMLPLCKMRMDRKDTGDAYHREIRRLLQELLVTLLLSAMETPADKAEGVYQADYQREELIDDFFHNYFYLSAGEPYLAQRLGVSCRQLERILKKSYGKSFREKQTESRMEIACDLLSSSRKTVQEISECVGYSIPSNFVVAFKRFVGMTPTEYRKFYKK